MGDCVMNEQQDMINVKNPPALSLGENRVYFGLWAIMKSPLLLSSNLPTLVPELTSIINNTEVISVNQGNALLNDASDHDRVASRIASLMPRIADSLGVQARKLVVGNATLPWKVGLAPCDSAPKRFYNRNWESTGVEDTREWSVNPRKKTAAEATTVAAAAPSYTVRSLSTGRCLSAAPEADAEGASNGGGVELMPCDEGSAAQAWGFGKGLHSPSSMYLSHLLTCACPCVCRPHDSQSPPQILRTEQRSHYVLSVVASYRTTQCTTSLYSTMVYHCCACAPVCAWVCVWVGGTTGTTWPQGWLSRSGTIPSTPSSTVRIMSACRRRPMVGPRSRWCHATTRTGAHRATARTTTTHRCGETHQPPPVVSWCTRTA